MNTMSIVQAKGVIVEDKWLAIAVIEQNEIAGRGIRPSCCIV